MASIANHLYMFIKGSITANMYSQISLLINSLYRAVSNGITRQNGISFSCYRGDGAFFNIEIQFPFDAPVTQVI